MNGFTQITQRFNGKATQTLFELDHDFDGYKMVIVSIKKDGVDGLSASYFIWGTHDGDVMGDELRFDFGDNHYNCDDVLNKLINPQ